jgi:prevent-host-death family protein
VCARPRPAFSVNLSAREELQYLEPAAGAADGLIARVRSGMPNPDPGRSVKLNLVYIWSSLETHQGSDMKLADQPITYLKSDAAQIVKDLAASGEPLLITQNGEAKLVVQDVQSYEDTQQTLALLKILALGQKDIEQGKFKEADAFPAGLDDLDRKEQIG